MHDRYVVGGQIDLVASAMLFSMLRFLLSREHNAGNVGDVERGALESA